MKPFLLIFNIILAVSYLEAEEPLVVHLQGDQTLFLTYLAPVGLEQTTVTSEYASKLNEFLKFDLNHNGMTRVISKKPQLQKIAQDDRQKWKEHSIFYTVFPSIHGGELSAKIVPVFSATAKEITGIPVTGQLELDREQVHRLADTIYSTLFGEEGIASTHLLYTTGVQCETDWFSEVWEAGYDGAHPRQLTRGGGYCVTPTYLPPKKGKKSGNFFYVSYKTGQPKIFVASLKDGVGRRFSTLNGNQLMPAASRQRNLVAFISDATGNPDLFIQEFSPEVGAVGLPRQIFAAPHATQGTPTFSPDGSKVAFVSDQDGSPRIYMIEVPPEGLPLKKIRTTLITKYQQGSTAPAWSPDGTKIAFCSRIDGVRQIFYYDLKREETTQLTTGKGNKENPTWAPNSLVLAYNTSDEGDSAIYLVTLKEPQPTKLTLGPGQKHYPSWEAR